MGRDHNTGSFLCIILNFDLTFNSIIFLYVAAIRGVMRELHGDMTKDNRGISYFAHVTSF